MFRVLQFTWIYSKILPIFSIIRSNFPKFWFLPKYWEMLVNVEPENFCFREVFVLYKFLFIIVSLYKLHVFFLILLLKRSFCIFFFGETKLILYDKFKFYVFFFWWSAHFPIGSFSICLPSFSYQFTQSRVTWLKGHRLLFQYKSRLRCLEKVISSIGSEPIQFLLHLFKDQFTKIIVSQCFKYCFCLSKKL